MTLRKILFVDDDPRILSAMRRRFANDFNLVTFEKGHEAVTYIRSNNDISVLVADMRMPGMDGLELLKHSQEIRPDLKRIMLTGNSDQKTAVDAINEGRVFRFLKKPCDASEVKAAIKLAIEESDFSKADIGQIQEQMVSNSKDTDQQGLFLSVMSEELRTPLSQVISISDTLNKQELLINERARARMLRQIGEAGKNALSRVDRILTFVKLQSAVPGKGNSEVRLDLIAAEEIARFRARASERNVTISFESNLVPVVVRSSEESLRVGIRESLDNAVKFNQDNGHISVQIKANKEKAAIRISNTGSNMSEHSSSSDNVFKPADAGLSRENYGMGLGVSLINAAAISGGYNYDIWPRKDGGAWVTFVFETCSEEEQP